MTDLVDVVGVQDPDLTLRNVLRWSSLGPDGKVLRTGGESGTWRDRVFERGVGRGTGTVTRPQTETGKGRHPESRSVTVERPGVGEVDLSPCLSSQEKLHVFSYRNHMSSGGMGVKTKDSKVNGHQLESGFYNLPFKGFIC